MTSLFRLMLFLVVLQAPLANIAADNAFFDVSTLSCVEPWIEGSGFLYAV
jgi:hypothetical protein